MSRPAPPLETVDQAIQWMIALHYQPADDDTRTRFETWRAADPQHALAWQQLQDIGNGLRQLPAGLSPQLASSALAHAAPRTAARRRALKTLGGGSAAVAALGVALWITRDTPAWRPLLAEHRTRRGERRTLTLADGSTLHLGTDSAVDIDYSPQQRRIVLRQGEILLDSAPDSHSVPRPLLVATRHGLLHALGTRFTVRLQADATLLHVLQDRVALHPAGQPAAAPVIATAGQAFRLTREQAVPADIPPHDPAAWADGVLSVRDMPLPRLLDELARHYPGRLQYADGLAPFTVSGTFQLDDIPRTLALLAESLPLHIEARSVWWRDSLHVSRRPPPAAPVR
ncbi:DUF4880 domain-containing protein [Pseudothauera nasutitermitis]|uniref:DUF4880 domain-containing protein n=1 Tax=Pseudothauera nasutitermitis TaxID=2565930 RepID=A0A4S4AZH5_9RHOO|nr:FecR domain-containing protein [Pseudothauera nasutitermitis]THF65589.1 DUF4880 domain-containing protein [Pseudothauera nasutitermitis]